MPADVSLLTAFPTGELSRLVKQPRNKSGQILALAAALDGRNSEGSARIGGIDYQCNDPAEFCSSVMMRRETREHDDGPRRKEMDCATEKRATLQIIQGKTTLSEMYRQFGLAPSEIEDLVEQGKAGMENA